MEKDEEKTKYFHHIYYSNENMSNVEHDDTDLEQIEPYMDIDNIKEHSYEIHEPTDKVSSSKQGIKISSDEDANKSDNKNKTGEPGENEATSSNSGDKTNSSEHDIHVEITPQMIVAALKNLHYRKYTVSFEEIMGYIRCHYPVQTNIDELKNELMQKIRCACHLGFVKEENGNYRLTLYREKLHLKKSDFRAFWESYLKNPKNIKEIQSKNFEKTPRRSERLDEKQVKKKRKLKSQSPPTRKQKSAPCKSKRRKRETDSSSSNSSTTQDDEKKMKRKRELKPQSPPPRKQKSAPCKSKRRKHETDSNCSNSSATQNVENKTKKKHELESQSPPARKQKSPRKNKRRECEKDASSNSSTTRDVGTSSSAIPPNQDENATSSPDKKTST